MSTVSIGKEETFRSESLGIIKIQSKHNSGKDIVNQQLKESNVSALCGLIVEKGETVWPERFRKKLQPLHNPQIFFLTTAERK